MTLSNRKLRRAGHAAAFGMAGALALGLMPGVAGAVARDTEDSCPDGAAPDAGFTDTGGSVAEAEIDCIVAYGLSSGTGNGSTYSPLANVTRGQMASFIARKLELVAPLPTDSPDAFDDDDGSVHEDNIDIVADLGIAQGDSAGNFNPGANVSRGQMATFLVGQLEAAGATIPTGVPDGFDDDEGDVHEDNINIVNALGLAQGDSAGDYNPTDGVLRQQMALFLARDLDYLVEEGLVSPITVTSGMVGTVNVFADTFRVINEVTGTDVSGDINYNGGTTFTVDGGASTLGAFDDDLNEGDIVSFNGTGSFTLTNAAVSGEATDVQVSGGATLFKINGVLGDEPAVGLPTDEGDYIASSTSSPGAESFTIGGVPSTYAAFEAALTDGDTVTYSRENDVETFALTT